MYLTILSTLSVIKPDDEFFLLKNTTVTHFSPLFNFYIPWKRQKTFNFPIFSGDIEMGHWAKWVILENQKRENKNRCQQINIINLFLSLAKKTVQKKQCWKIFENNFFWSSLQKFYRYLEQYPKRNEISEIMTKILRKTLEATLKIFFLKSFSENLPSTINIYKYRLKNSCLANVWNYHFVYFKFVYKTLISIKPLKI